MYQGTTSAAARALTRRTKRQEKYYVSELKPSPIGTVWHRLTKYYLTEIEARKQLTRLSVHYENLFVRSLLPNNKRRTLA